MTRPFPTPRDERGVVAPSRLMLVAIVVVAIGGAMFFATTPKKDNPTAGSAANAASETSQTTQESAASTPSSSPSSATPKPSKTPKPSTSPSSKPSAKPSATPSEPAADEPATPVKKGKTRVAVFNNTGQKGLAQRTAQRVTGSGWKVTGAANWYGTIPSTTVYYPAGMKSAAQSLAKDLGVRRVMPAVKPMREDRLTLILTSDYSA